MPTKGDPLRPESKRKTRDYPWPYCLPNWRDSFRSVSPDGQRVAQIDPAIETGMSNPTTGMLCVTSGPHIERCSPSFIWSDDSRYLAVTQFHGFLGRQRVLILDFTERHVYASRRRAWFLQPDSFVGGKLRVRTSVPEPGRFISFNVPADLTSRFKKLRSLWPRNED